MVDYERFVDRIGIVFCEENKIYYLKEIGKNVYLFAIDFNQTEYETEIHQWETIVHEKCQ